MKIDKSDSVDYNLIRHILNFVLEKHGEEFEEYLKKEKIKEKLREIS